MRKNTNRKACHSYQQLIEKLINYIIQSSFAPDGFLNELAQFLYEMSSRSDASSFIELYNRVEKYKKERQIFSMDAQRAHRSKQHASRQTPSVANTEPVKTKAQLAQENHMRVRSQTPKFAIHQNNKLPLKFNVSHNGYVKGTEILFLLPNIDEAVVIHEGRPWYFPFSVNLLFNKGFCEYLRTNPQTFPNDIVEVLAKNCLSNNYLMSRAQCWLFDMLTSICEYAKNIQLGNDKAVQALRSHIEDIESRNRAALRTPKVITRKISNPATERERPDLTVSKKENRVLMPVYRAYEWEKDTFVEGNGVIRGTYSYNPSEPK